MPTHTHMHETFRTIRAAFTALRRDQKARHCDIAQTLGISEGELIAAHVAAPDPAAVMQAIRLRNDWPLIIGAMEPLGLVMALTRNASCVHEKVGVYRKASHDGGTGQVQGGEIDLRLHYRQWAHGFAVNEHREQGVQRSLQFFDAAGTAIHKIFMKPQSDLAALETLTVNFIDVDQSPGLPVDALPAATPEATDESIDVAGFRQAWSSLRDTHEFLTLLKKFAISHTQGLRLAEKQYVQQVDKGSANDLLNLAAQEGVPIVVCVGNHGLIQTHSGPIRKVAVLGPWLNVLDHGFNLHLREDQIASAWVVKKPTVDGMVTSLELFDAQGEAIAMFFGERKPGKPEICSWRGLIENLLQEPLACPA